MSTDNNPGITSYPKTDIKTHRQTAKTCNIIGVGMLILATHPAAPTSGVVAGAAIMFTAANGLNLQALRWETNLDHGDDQQ